MRLARLCALLGVMTSSVEASATPDEAARLLKEAGAAMDQKDWATCEAKAEEAWKQFQQVAIAGALGICEIEQGKYAEAANHLDFFVRLSRADSRRADAEAKLAEAKKFVAEVAVACPDADANLFADGRELGKGPQTVFLEPGARKFEAKKTNVVIGVREEKLVAGTKITVHIALGGSGVGGGGVGGGDCGTGGTGDSSEKADPIWPAIVLGSVAAAGIGAGIALVVVGNDATSEYEETPCPGDASTCPTEVSDAVDQRNAMVVGGGIAMGVAIAALGGMIVDLAVRDDGESPNACFFPIVSPTTAGGGFNLRF